MLAADAQRIADLMAQSPLKPGVGKEGLCKSYVTAEAQIDDLRMKLRGGRITGEEHKALSGALSNLKRLGEQLQVFKPVDKDLGAL